MMKKKMKMKKKKSFPDMSGDGKVTKKDILMARGEAEYQGKLLEARQSDWKDEFILILLSAPIALLSWAVFSDDPAAMEKMKLFFEFFSATILVPNNFCRCHSICIRIKSN